MSTDFFRKKGAIFLLVSALTFTISCLFYALSFKKLHTVDVDANFYFLVSTEENVSVGVEYTKLDGGAGYLLQKDGKEYAVWSVYFDEKTGADVQERLKKAGKETQLIYLGTDTVCFRTWREKGKEKPTVELLRIVKGCMQILNETISRLEKGMTQEKAKAILTLLRKQLSFSAREYAVCVDGLANVCKESAKHLDNILEGTVYTDALAYELCFLADGYLSSCNRFSL